VLSGLAFTLVGCAARTIDPQASRLGAPTRDEAARPRTLGGEGLASASYCPGQFTCDTSDAYYPTKAQCTAACGSDPCRVETNCALRSCICP
jgi:hypothetical protein